MGWRVSSSMHSHFVLDTLEQALHDRQPERDGALTHHSDRGSQYVSIRYSERLTEVGIEFSVGNKGYDNALAEGLYKAEVIHRQLADQRIGGAGHAAMGGLVQSSPVAWTRRVYPAGRS